MWPFWLAGAACEGGLRPDCIEPPIYRRRVDFFTKSRAFDITRARARLGTIRRSGCARDPGDAGVVSERGWLNPRSASRTTWRTLEHPRAEKYAALIVGQPGWANTQVRIRGDSVTKRPLDIGLARRRSLYPWLMGACGRTVVFGQNVVRVTRTKSARRNVHR